LGIFRNWYAATSIRRVYQLMVKAAQTSGYPRPESETPFEYLQSLQKVWPRHQAECRRITDAFVKVRYGELPETAEELNEIVAAWHTLAAAEPMTLTSE